MTRLNLIPSLCLLIGMHLKRNVFLLHGSLNWPATRILATSIPNILILRWILVLLQYVFLIQHGCSRIHQILICLCLKTFTTIVITIQGKRIKRSISVIYVLFKIDPFIASCFLRFPDYMNICYGIFMNIYDFFDVEMESKKNNWICHVLDKKEFCFWW